MKIAFSQLCAVTLCLSVAQICLAATAYIEKEIDDDHIIVLLDNNRRVLLEKWSVRLSPVVFEGKSFHAEVSPMWVTIYIPNRSEIKWSIEEELGSLSAPPTVPNTPSIEQTPSQEKRTEQTPSSSIRPITDSELITAFGTSDFSNVGNVEFCMMLQSALTLAGHDTKGIDGKWGANSEGAMQSFQRKSGLAVSGKPSIEVVRLLYPIALRRAIEIDQANVANSQSAPTISQKSRSKNIAGVLETQIDGDFEGWEGDSILKTLDGGIWEQVDGVYEYYYAFMPKVILIPQEGELYKMVVPGMSSSAIVSRVR